MYVTSWKNISYTPSWAYMVLKQNNYKNLLELLRKKMLQQKFNTI